MAWLGTWKYRRKVTVSNTNIDSNLTHFPLLLTLGTSVGTGSADVSSIFDELTSDANRTKIAFTKTDGTTQLYAEIEKWDDATEKAVIWISKSDLVLASGATTDVYMYYDSAQSANTTYIGDTNDTQAESVWDSNYKMVQHLADGASTSATYDSTSNDNDGTKNGAAEPAVTTSGEIGNAQDFDGSDDYINVDVLNNDIAAATTGTVSFWIKVEADNADEEDVFDITRNVDAVDTELRIIYDMRVDHKWLAVGCEIDNVNHWKARSPLNSLSTYIDSWLLVSITHNGTSAKIYYNGVSQTLTWQDNGENEDKTLWFKAFLTDATSPADVATIGALRRDGSDIVLIDGLIDEVRVSITARSAAWIKANYYSETDALVAWGAEETGATEFTVTISETITTTEVLAKPVNYNKSFAETFSVTEILNKLTSYAKLFSASFLITEVLEVCKAVIIDVSETIGLTETLNKASAYAKTFSANLSITETLGVTRSVILSFVESISITESLAKLMAYSRSKVESFSITDTLSFVDKYWKELTKHTSSYTGISKHTSSWTNKNKS